MGRLVGRVLLAIVLMVAGFGVWVYVESRAILTKRYPMPATALTVPTHPAAIARGEHLVLSVGACVTCHGPDMGGLVYADMGPVGVIAGRNLTRGRGGIGGQFTDADWVRAIRYGLHADGTSLLMMPSEVYTRFTDADLGAIVAYLKQVPPVDREVPASRFKPLGRMLLATGQLELLAAPKTFHEGTAASAPPEVSIGYGRYLADVSGCHGCHGPGLSGGHVDGPDNLPPAANLTPAGLGSWTQADFVRAIREGKRRDGSAVNEFMPWRSYASMTDGELEALWLYLRSVPSKPSGGR
ncbi:MAG TPA: c-type cytochrome [Nonomuraea sp.]|nr:c-type cytochrome [Nonomuraea sp.]